MHFCIPVSQQRPDALGGRYVVRPGLGVRAAGTRRGRGSPPADSDSDVSVSSCIPCTWTGLPARCVTASCIKRNEQAGEDPGWPQPGPPDSSVWARGLWMLDCDKTPHFLRALGSLIRVVVTG